MRKVLTILGQLNDADVAWMAAAGRRRTFRPGEVLISEGVRSGVLFILLEGEVEVAVGGIGTVARLGAGEVLGEMSFVDRAPPSATVRAGAVAVAALALDTARMEAQLARDPGFAARFYRALAIFLADRLRDTTARGRAGSRIADAAAVPEQDELDDVVLDGIAVAGLRFQQILRTLGGDPPAG